MGNRYDIATLYVDERGKEFEVDGIEYTVKIVPDQDTSAFDDGDWLGSLEWSRRTNDYGWPSRPDEMDGDAEILERDRGSVLWWQPPKDLSCRRGTPEFAQFRGTVKELLEYGYVGVIVEDQFGNDAALWGIGAMDTDYHGEVACDLIDDCIAAQKKMIGATA